MGKIFNCYILRAYVAYLPNVNNVRCYNQLLQMFFIDIARSEAINVHGMYKSATRYPGADCPLRFAISAGLVTICIPCSFERGVSFIMKMCSFILT